MSWAEIKKAINSNISKSLDVLITEKCNELQSKLNSVYNTVTVTGNIPSVKSVQRGKVNRMVVSAKSDGYNVGGGDPFRTCYYDIAINSVNIDKSIVLCAGSNTIDTSPCRFILLDSNTIRVYFSYNSHYGPEMMAFTWQVIEFY